MQVTSLHRYPVKGLSPEALDSLTLTAGAYVPGDRLFAIENGPSGFDPDHPQHQPKIKFLMLMRHEALATLRTRYDDATGRLFIERDGRPFAAGDLATPEGREAIESFFRDFMAEALRGAPKVLTAPPGFRFTDSRAGYVSILNEASIAEVARWVGRPVDPLRLRGNILVTGLDAFAELDLVGARLAAPSGLVLKVTKRIVRCAATNVDPTTGARDLDIPATLMRRLGHADCGIYAEIVRGGALSPGDALEIVDAAQGALPL